MNFCGQIQIRFLTHLIYLIKTKPKMQEEINVRTKRLYPNVCIHF